MVFLNNLGILPHQIATFCLKTGLKLGLESRLKSLVETRDFVKVSSRRDSHLVEKSRSVEKGMDEVEVSFYST